MTKQMKGPLDPLTFGDFACAKQLVEMINENSWKGIRSSVTTIMEQTLGGLNALSKVLPVYRRQFAKLWKHEMFRRIDQSSMPDDFKSFTKNTVTAHVRTKTARAVEEVT